MPINAGNTAFVLLARVPYDARPGVQLDELTTLLRYVLETPPTTRWIEGWPWQ
jgi:hypothetical protein